MGGLIKKSLLKNTKSKDAATLRKLQTPKVAEPVLKGSTDLVSRIKDIIKVVSKELGKYREKYIVIRDEKTALDYFKHIKINGIAAIDTETTSLDPITGDVVGVCLYTPGEKPAYIPINHISYITQQKLENQLSKEFIAVLLQDAADIKWIFHNAKFDIEFVYCYFGVYLKCYWDTLLGAKCLNENESAALKELHLKYCNSSDHKAFTFDTLFNGIPFNYIPINTGYLYAAGDAIKTFELYEFQAQYLNRRVLPGCANVLRNIEIPCIDCVVELELTGVELDRGVISDLAERYSSILVNRKNIAVGLFSQYEHEIKQYIADHPDKPMEYPVNISSATQLSIFFYDILHCIPVQLKGKKASQSMGTGKDVLKELPDYNPELNIKEICKAILDYRETEKLMNTYIEKLPNTICPKDNRVHGHFNQYGAATGRFSSSDPNLQNIPSHNKEIRTMFKATEGYVMVGADYS